ncbi:MAG TPA: 1-deoxy-D-xylulose-5-phosphate reductoisomerase [Planctomycetota bacterium]|nr:1-deoxy-D-xylulose-5-phosphate reductoisomerase [Planctomycetota bacterium]
MKRLAVLGSTGSIGTSTLLVADGLRDLVRIEALAAGTSWQKLAEQCRAVGTPRLLAMADAASARQLEKELKLTAGTVLVGEEGMRRIAADPNVDVVLTAMVGAQGLGPTLAAVEAGKTLALANKEPLVMAGALVMAAAKKSGATILPVDSEHSAVFQLLGARRKVQGSSSGAAGVQSSLNPVSRIILCASGGPFRTWPAERIGRATVEDALNHPTWDMGRKITVDSATLMNKALEVIEAHWLFSADFDRIGVLIQPQSLIHAMVEFADGTLLAHLSAPDMCLPIQYALTWPERRPFAGMKTLGLADLAGLSFEAPDTGRFPALELGYRAGRAGGTAGAALNGANEAAVELFLAGRIPFGEIPRLVAAALDAHEVRTAADLAAVVAADRWAREFVAKGAASLC